MHVDNFSLTLEGKRIQIAAIRWGATLLGGLFKASLLTPIETN
jgi:hypothetical protein